MAGATDGIKAVGSLIKGISDWSRKTQTGRATSTGIRLGANLASGSKGRRMNPVAQQKLAKKVSEDLLTPALKSLRDYLRSR